MGEVAGMTPAAAVDRLDSARTVDDRCRKWRMTAMMTSSSDEEHRGSPRKMFVGDGGLWRRQLSKSDCAIGMESLESGSKF